MVRKNYFLYENAAARIFCGMNPEKEYRLKPLGSFLKQAVEARLATIQKSKEEKA